MKNYYIEVELHGSVWVEDVVGDECRFEGYVACTQKAMMWLDAESAEEAEKFAVRYNYQGHKDCEIEEDIEVWDVTVEESGEPVGQPTVVEIGGSEYDY